MIRWTLILSAAGLTAERNPCGVTATGSNVIERVSTLELFFDLVFVFTITQLTAVLAYDPDLLHLLRVGVMLAIIFWMYGGYAWLTNAVAANTTARRLVLLGGMAGFLLVSLAVPGAFVLVHIALFTRTQRLRSARDLARIGLLNIAGTALILVGGVLGGIAQLVLWILVPLVWWLVSPYRQLSGAFDIGTAHFVERHGLVLIIAIGESLIALALGLRDLKLGPALAAVAVLGLALSACLWWDLLRWRRHSSQAGAQRCTSGTSRPAGNRGFWPRVPWSAARRDRRRRGAGERRPSSVRSAGPRTRGCSRWWRRAVSGQRCVVSQTIADRPAWTASFGRNPSTRLYRTGSLGGGSSGCCAGGHLCRFVQFGISAPKRLYRIPA